MASFLTKTAMLAAALGQCVAGDLIMDELKVVPELSTYAYVYNRTGGIKEINPMFLKRFDSDEDKKNYTFFAPTNDAWAKIPEAIFEVLTAQPAYPLTEALLRSHIIEAQLNTTQLAATSSDSTTSGGISSSLQLVNTTKQVHRGTLVKMTQGYYVDVTTSTNGTLQLDGMAQINEGNLVCDNGLIHEIDQLIDPFLVYGGGPSNRTAAPTVEQTDKTIADFLTSDSRLGNTSAMLSVNSPNAIRRLGRTVQGDQQFFVAAQNEAYDLMPTILPVWHTLVAPYKSPFNSLMFEFGWVESGGAGAFSGLNFTTVSVPSDATQLNLTATTEGDAVFLMNAGLVTQVEAANGILWIVDRWLDPLYEAFGSVDRFGEAPWN